MTAEPGAITLLAASQVAANLARVRHRVTEACERAGRDPTPVTLVGVTKAVPSALVRAALAAGLDDLGENYVQEAALKRAALGAGPARWHLIGHLQSNKVKAALETFDIIQAVDSIGLAEAIDRRATFVVPILLEVNAANDPSKFGLPPSSLDAAVQAIRALPRIDLRGLMTIAPAVRDPEDVRHVFRSLRRLAQAHGLPELSMGMSGDFGVAIEEGATIVRIGRAIFGERPA